MANAGAVPVGIWMRRASGEFTPRGRYDPQQRMWLDDDGLPSNQMRGFKASYTPPNNAIDDSST